MSIKARNSPRELFMREPPEGSGPLYRNLIHPRRPVEVAARQRCEEMWRLFQPLADPNFLERLPFEFHQRWFEMYLGAGLVSAGLDVSAPTPGRGPDFEIRADGRRVYVEAVCATAGDPLHEDAVPEPIYRDAEGNAVCAPVPHDRITLRLAHSVRAKLNAFDRYRGAGLVRSDDACVIAVNLREIPHAWADAKEFFFRAVYGVGNRYMVIDPQAREVVATGREHRTLLTRASGAAEEVAPMLDPNHEDVCAILGSSADAWNMREPFGDDFVLMPHASALAPLPRGLIRRGAEVSLYPGEESGTWTIDETDYGAPEPRGPEPFVVEHEGTQFEGEWEISGRELQVRMAGHGSAVLFRGTGDPADAAREIAIEMLRVYGAARCSSASRPSLG
jgi:hypothetical protein